MATRNEMLRELFVENGLVKDEDTYILPYGKGVTIITRSGIEKIQYHNNIQVNYFVESIVPPDFVVIKAIAKKGDIVMESYGEASSKNTKQTYPVAMAEKRALSRVVLKITGFYKYGGVFGEDESDDFKREQAA
jgi:hypothetical protein|tara:strand:- start:74 stop:475 length:402 start_codon:yes stop_codon:yes gene_type:complete